MLFNSYIFVLLFLPLCLVGYFMLNHFKLQKVAQVFLLGMSLWFYGYFNANYLWIIIFSVGMNYLCYRGMCRWAEQKVRKAIMLAGVVMNVGVLFYFKYFDFFLENINIIFKADFALRNILLPLGISFFTFQQISFIVDIYQKEVPPYSLLDYACFVTFFPQLIAGPIVSHHELVPQFMDPARKKFQWDNMAQGIYLFVLGLGKKVLLADSLGKAANYGFLVSQSLNATDTIFVMLAYTLQIYFDFSGYCDMAIGIGKMFNIDLPLNFNSPYKATTIKEFWDRWHMTLTRFLTKYIYIPLGGNRKGIVRTCTNIFIVFLVSGFWHGANWTFVFWGACHGIASVFNRLFDKYISKIPKCIKWFVTFIFLNFTWLIFRADSIKEALTMMKNVFVGGFGRVSYGLAQSMCMAETDKMEMLFLRMTGVDLPTVCPEWILLLFVILGILLLAGKKNAYEKMQCFKPTFGRMMFAFVIFIWCVLSFSGVSTFLYFNF